MGPFSTSSTPATQTPARTPARVHSSASLGAMFSAAMNHPTSFSDGSIPEGAFSPYPRFDATAGTTGATPVISLPTPSTFADEGALRRLDALTREAIDERLKVLEDVQIKLWSAAEELKKVKSSLPPPAAAAVMTTTTLPTSLPVEGYVSAPESGYASVVGRGVEVERMNELVSSVGERLVMDTKRKGKGKGKERAVVEDEDRPALFESQSQQLTSQLGVGGSEVVLGGGSGGATGQGQGEMRRGEEDDLLFSMDALLVDPESGDVVQ